MTSTKMQRTVRASALYDLLVTVGFAFPFSAPLVLSGLANMHHALQLPGSVPDATDAFTVMFANLMGSLVVVWSVFRLARPTRATGIADTAGRLSFSLAMAAALIAGASPLVAGILILELVWAAVQGIVVARKPVTVAA
ncbi:hypothetical protein [Frigoribacterium sp. MCBA15_019]|uniref:hypothetical protein n=1 Tax=Frigoribacterium sp. MCBA15_019 TaxID=1898745 RepID=UPI0008DD0FA5|nr:hypothetical protein [Frigoribacterium sp. MCBA15_019]OII23940.1 hypothetical protein BIV04_07815 [Frigoribacterium sp. MCBA15_019]